MLKYSIMVSCGLRLSCKVMVVMKSTLVKRKCNDVISGKEVLLGRKTFFDKTGAARKNSAVIRKIGRRKRYLKKIKICLLLVITDKSYQILPVFIVWLDWFIGPMPFQKIKLRFFKVFHDCSMVMCPEWLSEKFQTFKI